MLASIASTLLFLPLAAATSFKYNDDMTCSSPVALNVESMTCEGSPVCQFGQEMQVYGSVSLDSDLPSSEMCATVKTCFMGLGFICKTYMKDETVDICEFMGTSSTTDGTACPSYGAFYFDEQVALPGSVEWRLGTGWWVTLKVDVTDCNPYSSYEINCKATFDAVASDTSVASESSSDWEDWTMSISGAALFGVAAVVYSMSRKRRAARIDLSSDSQDGEGGNFEMMMDSGVRA